MVKAGHSRRPAAGVAALLLLAALAISLWMTLGAAGAEARAFTLTGRVIGDSNATVTARLVKRRGTPRVIKRVVFRKLDHSSSRS